MNISRIVRDKYFLARGSYPVMLAGDAYRVNPEHRRFWRRAEKKEWEPSTYRILDQFLDKDSVYCDIGSWIGPTVIVAARKAKQVYSFEPDAIAHRYLLGNLQRNHISNVMTLNVALAERDGMMKMASFNSELGASESTLLDVDGRSETVDVYTMTWQTWQNTFKPLPINMLKIDVEGGEFELLPTMADYLQAEKPVLFLSLHAPYLNEQDRQPALERIHAALSHYKTCLDEELNEVPLHTLLSDQVKNEFISFVLTH